MRPRDALQMQTDLRTSLLNPDWVGVTDWMLASMDVQRTYRDPLANDLRDAPHQALVMAYLGARDEQGLPSLGKLFVERERRTLGLALTYIVAAHMEGLVRMAAADWPDEMLIEPDMLPSADGFLIFEKAWSTTDVRGNEIKVKAISWSSIPGGVLVNEFSSLLEPDEPTRRQRAEMGPEEWSRLSGMGILHFHHTFQLKWYSTIETWTTPDVSLELHPEIRDSSVGPAKAFMALLKLMQQEITDVRAHRQTAKRQQGWKRKHIPGEVSVITLRRKAMHSEAEHDAIVHDCHWPVRGHWAWRWAGSERLGTRHRKRVYIHPFLKGNLEAPLRVTKKIQVLTR